MSDVPKISYVEMKHYENTEQDTVTLRKRCMSWNKGNGYGSSHLARGVWVEIDCLVKPFFHGSSHLARGVWVEINITNKP